MYSLTPTTTPCLGSRIAAPRRDPSGSRPNPRRNTRARLCVLSLALLWAGACDATGAGGGSESIVAQVGTEPITAGDIEALLPPDSGEPVRLPGVAPPDPTRQALE